MLICDFSAIFYVFSTLWDIAKVLIPNFHIYQHWLKGEGGLKVSTLIFCHFPLIFDDDCQNTVFPLHSQIEKYAMYLRIFRISLPLKWLFTICLGLNGPISSFWRPFSSIFVIKHGKVTSISSTIRRKCSFHLPLELFLNG